MSETQSLTLGFAGPQGNRLDPGTWRWVTTRLPTGRQHLIPGWLRALGVVYARE